MVSLSTYVDASAVCCREAVLGFGCVCRGMMVGDRWLIVVMAEAPVGLTCVWVARMRGGGVVADTTCGAAATDLFTVMPG